MEGGSGDYEAGLTSWGVSHDALGSFLTSHAVISLELFRFIPFP